MAIYVERIERIGRYGYRGILVDDLYQTFCGCGNTCLSKPSLHAMTRCSSDDWANPRILPSSSTELAVWPTMPQQSQVSGAWNLVGEITLYV
jgi:hypothetical protein